MKKKHRFLIESLLSLGIVHIENQNLTHLIRNVLKLKVGEGCILFFDGGNDYLSSILDIKKDVITFNIVSIINKKIIPKKLKACISITKRDSFELVVQKLTEIGIREIVPIISDRTIKQSINISRLQKISDEALEQSGGSYRVKILEPVSLKDSLNSSKDTNVIYFDMAGEKNKKISEDDLTFYIGPEGGWSDNDLELFKNHNILGYKLGETTLRAETASIIAGYKLLWD